MSYDLEILDHAGRWCPVMTNVQLGWGAGWLAHHREAPGPRLAARLVRRKDGKVMDEAPSRPEAAIGMVAGWPEWWQYAGAAARACNTGMTSLRRTIRDDKLPRNEREELEELMWELELHAKRLIEIYEEEVLRRKRTVTEGGEPWTRERLSDLIEHKHTYRNRGPGITESLATTMLNLLAERDTLRARVRALRDVVQWSENHCTGQCRGMCARALEDDDGGAR